MLHNVNPADTDVVILCGGKDKGLCEVVNDRPKPLANVWGRPFLDLLIDFTAVFGFNRFILLAGYLGEMIEEYAVKKAGQRPLDINCVIEPYPLGTGGAIKNARGYINSSRFLLLNGDSVCPADLREFLIYHGRKGALATMMLSYREKEGDFSSVSVDENGRILSLRGKAEGPPGMLVDAGVYMMERVLIDLIPVGNACSFKYDILPSVLGKELYGCVVTESALDVTTPESYFKTLEVLSEVLKIGCEEW